MFTSLPTPKFKPSTETKNLEKSPKSWNKLKKFTTSQQAELASWPFISLLRRNLENAGFQSFMKTIILPNFHRTPFKTWDYSSGTVGNPILLPFIHTKSQIQPGELLDSQTRNQTKPNKNRKVNNTLIKDITFPNLCWNL